MPQMPDWIRIKHCKKIITRDVNGRENGFLCDILNRNDEIYHGREKEYFQQVYYSTVYKGMFKGFHIHPFKYDTVTTLYGNALLVIYPQLISQGELNTVIQLEDLITIPINADETPFTVSFPSKYPHGYYGLSEIAYIMNYRNPAWHPGDTHQYDYKYDGIEEFLFQFVATKRVTES